MKKIIALCMTLIMIFSLFCGVTAHAEEPVTLTITSWFTEQAVGKIYEDLWQEAADALGYNIIVDQVDTETFKTKNKVMMASGEMNDITTMWGLLLWLEPYITSGSCICVDEYIENSDVKYLDSAKNPYYADGKSYLFPTHASNQYYLFYNKQIVEELGLPMPVTMDDIYEIIDKCKAAGIDAFGLPVKDRWQADMMYEGLVMREDPTAWDRVLSGEITYDSEVFLKAAYTAQQLVKDGAFPDDALNIGGADGREMFFAGRFAFFVDGGWRWANLLENMGDNLGYVPFPMTGSDESYKDVALTQPGYGLIISSKCEHKDEAANLCLKYVELIGEYLAEQGRINIVETDTQPKVEINPEYAKMMEDTAMIKKNVPTWVDNLPAEKAQVSYDLALELFGLMITPEEYVKQYAEMLAQ